MFSWLAKRLGFRSDRNRGISIELPYWQIDPPENYADFFRQLPELLPEGSVLYIEGHPRQDVVEFLDARPAPVPCKVARGTIWPKPRVYHIPATPEHLLELAGFADRCADPEIADHVHAYRENAVLVSWYDFPFDPILASCQLPERQVREWAVQLGCTCELVEPSA